MKKVLFILFILTMILMAGCKIESETEKPKTQGETSTIKQVDITTQDEFINEIDQLIEENLEEER